MSQFTVYKSSDTSAPSLTGQTGALITVLDAVLVNGYGSKSAAGWTKAFSGTSKAAYRQGTANQLYWRVQDDGPGAGTFKEARIVGYEAMTTVDAGTNPFPTAAQFTNGMFARKSTTADGTARTWVIIADNITCWVFVLTGDASGEYLAFGIGDIYSFQSADAYRTLIIGNNTENSATASVFGALSQNVNAATSGHYMPRGYSGTGTGVQVGRHGDVAKSGQQALMVGVVPYPNPEDGGFYLSPVWVHDPTTSAANNIRGYHRGIWQGLHTVGSVTDGDTFSGTGALAGKTFLVIKNVRSASSLGYVVVETSNTLLTN
jgi:hypothetical protein